MTLLRCLVPALAAVLLGAAPLRAVPIVSIDLPAAPVEVGESFSLTVRAVGPIETLSLLLDLPAGLVTPPGDVTLSAFPTPGDLPSETQTLLLGEFNAFGFYSEATADDYTQYLPLLPVGTGLLLGIVPQPPLMDAAAEVMFTGTFLATMPGTALFRLGFLATLSDPSGQEAFGTAQASFEILGSTTPPVDDPVGVPAPAGLALLLAGIAGLTAARRSAP